MSLIRDLGIIRFFPGKICYVKRPQLSNTTKIITQRSSSWVGGGVVGSGEGCVSYSITKVKTLYAELLLEIPVNMK